MTNETVNGVCDTSVSGGFDMWRKSNGSAV